MFASASGGGFTSVEPHTGTRQGRDRTAKRQRQQEQQQPWKRQVKGGRILHTRKSTRLMSHRPCWLPRAAPHRERWLEEAGVGASCGALRLPGCLRHSPVDLQHGLRLHCGSWSGKLLTMFLGICVRSIRQQTGGFRCARRRGVAPLCRRIGSPLLQLMQLRGIAHFERHEGVRRRDAPLVRLQLSLQLTNVVAQSTQLGQQRTSSVELCSKQGRSHEQKQVKHEQTAAARRRAERGGRIGGGLIVCVTSATARPIHVHLQTLVLRPQLIEELLRGLATTTTSKPATHRTVLGQREETKRKGEPVALAARLPRRPLASLLLLRHLTSTAKRIVAIPTTTASVSMGLAVRALHSREDMLEGGDGGVNRTLMRGDTRA